MMKSKYNGFCVKCSNRILIGDDIVKDPGLEKWVHGTCPEKGAGPKSHPRGKRNSNPTTALRAAASLAGRNQLQSAVTDEAVTAGAMNMDWKPSLYQEGIFDFIRSGKGNAVVEAVAGSGKTTTIIKGLDIVPKDASVCFLAFNKHIAKEIKDRLQAMNITHVHVSTIHSLGLSLIRKLPEFKGNRDGIDEDKVGGIMDEFWPVKKEAGVSDAMRKHNRMLRNVMRKVVSLAKATLIDVEDGNAIINMFERYGFQVDDSTPMIIEKLPYIMQKCLENVETVDYDDMIWLPIVHKRLRLHFDKFYYIFVDEAQDLNNSQIEFIKLCSYPESRIVCVGDRKQSLYGFRGADIEAIPRLIRELDATVLPLSISYRCPRSHVEMAKQIVPQIEASENAIEGVVADIKYKDFLQKVEPGDMVICRMNAPLVKPAFECIKAGKKAIIRGADIGKRLVNFIERFQAETLSQLEIMMNQYVELEYNRLLDKGKELQAETLVDEVDTIRVVASNCKQVFELVEKMLMLFSDSNVGVVFSSVHRAKGLEAERVFLLKREAMPHNKAKQDWELVQEDNCLYVALTRSKRELYFVRGGELE